MSEAEDASGKGSNLTAVDAISARLAEVTRLAEKLDARLCEAGARTRPVPMSSSVMSSTSSLFSSSNQPTTASSSLQGQSTPTGISSFATMPLISSSESTVPLGTKGVCTVLATRSGAVSKPAETSFTESNGGVAEAVGGVSEVAKTKEKILEKDVQETGSEVLLGADRMEGGEAGKRNDDVTEVNDVENMEKSCDDSLAEDSNVESYVTATECSVTPTARSRSESFVTSPECEDLAVATVATSANDSWNVEEPKFTTPNAAVSTSVIKQEEVFKGQNADKLNVSLENFKPDVYETNGEKQIEKLVSMEKRTDEKSGKIVKEVTETTTLRVSHDTRLGIASYKVISNTMQDHRENVDVKEIKEIERITLPDVHEKTNGLHQETETAESYTRRDELSTKTDDAERTIKFTKIYEMSQEEKPRVVSGDTSKDITLFLKEYTRHHEDSGIEMSPTKKEENPEGQDFLEKARKSGEWLRLKVLEVQPELTKLGASVEEATDLSSAHDEVLLRLQSKQSPVEELLRQADQLISNQRPRAEVYAAMAETLGQAWRDVNELLERRKQILDCNVLFQWFVRSSDREEDESWCCYSGFAKASDRKENESSS